ncbi:hypothetical protein KSP40_PGU001469 [Platanthera guangdongensis]|uniref:JmjC domain-containing protein n=1 Tax=Platanthera guangdongensis TaxID=2320717 RepID=A0ABR2M1F0_9ASPA
MTTAGVRRRQPPTEVPLTGQWAAVQGTASPGSNVLANNNEYVDGYFLVFDWRVNNDCSIPCPPKVLGGCGSGLLALKRTFKSNWVTNLINNAEGLINNCNFVNDSASRISSLCPENCSATVVDHRTSALRRATFRRSSHDNFLYCPNALELEDGEYAHFQKHWARGVPVIVRGVLEKTTGLSWDPMRFNEAGCCRSDLLEIGNGLAGKFFRGYVEGRIHQNGWPEMLKLKDWPPSSFFAERLPRHCSEFIAALPYKDYTHPVAGIMNLASRIPEGRPSPDLGPKTYIAYGFHDELGRGDTVTKLHCDISDAELSARLSSILPPQAIPSTGCLDPVFTESWQGEMPYEAERLLAAVASVQAPVAPVAVITVDLKSLLSIFDSVHFSYLPDQYTEDLTKAIMPISSCDPSLISSYINSFNVVDSAPSVSVAPTAAVDVSVSSDVAISVSEDMHMTEAIDFEPAVSEPIGSEIFEVQGLGLRYQSPENSPPRRFHYYYLIRCLSRTRYASSCQQRKMQRCRTRRTDLRLAGLSQCRQLLP